MLVPIQMGNEDDFNDLPPGGGDGNGNGNGNNNNTNNNPERDLWMENQRRQRSIRTLMMLLMMLVLMDGEEGQQQQQNRHRHHNNNNHHHGHGHGKKHGNMRGSGRSGSNGGGGEDEETMDANVWSIRRDLDVFIGQTYRHSHDHRHPDPNHPPILHPQGDFERWDRLLHLNHDVDEEKVILERLLAAEEEEAGGKASSSTSTSNTSNKEQNNHHKDKDSSTSSITSDIKEKDGKNGETKKKDGSDSDTNTRNADDVEKSLLVYHYPRNVTGLYRGEWTRVTTTTTTDLKLTNATSTSISAKSNVNAMASVSHYGSKGSTSTANPNPGINSTEERSLTREEVLNLLPTGTSTSTTPKSFIGIQHLPPNTIYDYDDPIWKKGERGKDGNDSGNEGGKNKKKQHDGTLSASTDDILTNNMKRTSSSVTATDAERGTSIGSGNGNGNGGNGYDSMTLDVTKESGTIIVQLFSRTIEGMTEMSLVDGVIKLTNVNDRSIISHLKHVTLRVRGVVIHSLGKISLVANDHLKSVFVVKDAHANAGTDVGADADAKPKAKANTIVVEEKGDDNYDGGEKTVRRRLMEVMSQNDVEEHVEALRDDALQMYGHLFDDHQVGGDGWNEHFTTPDIENLNRRKLLEQTNTDEATNDANVKNKVKGKAVKGTREEISEGGDESENDADATEKSSRIELQKPYVASAPWVPDDEEGSLIRIPANIMRATHDILLHNGRSCEFEIDFNIEETQWTLGNWYREEKELLVSLRDADPNSHNDYDRYDGTMTSKNDEETLKNYLDETYVMNMVGTINSPECNFMSNVNVTAIRTDWERTTSKAINYCFIMMMVCLTQTVYFLRQLVHSTPQSSALRVSLIMVGWQTLLDAMFCLSHILLCIILKPVTTAFAMVAFTKLLMFCVIEMKYMVMIMQARLNAAGENLSTEELRRRVAVMHTRFYCILLASISGLWHLKDNHRTLCVVIMYSFWVPQIIRNVITEARRPLHTSYIYAMSLTRLVAPIYTFAVPKNFYTEIEPDFPVDYFTCQVLIAWVGIQTAILIAQSKYGTRFMIPARCLPPKFDYSRPIPESMIPKPTVIRIDPDNTDSDPLLENDVIKNDSPGPRKRRNGNGSDSDESNGMTRVHDEECCERPTLDCVICYNEIDIGDREGYMLAPCDHIFHRQCLTQWMDVKMECPVCRTNLPSL